MLARFCLLVVFIILKVHVLSAQNGHFDLDEFVANSKPDEFRQRLQSEIKRNRGTALALYLEGYLEGDAAKAVEKYEQLLRKFPNSHEAPDALLKIAQYYFSRGLYVSARKYFLQLIELYPHSNHVDDSMYAAAACLFAAGKYESCYVELNNFLLQNPGSPLRELVMEDLKEVKDKTGYSARVASAKPSTTGNYALQIGAFSKKSNAHNLKNYCEKLGLHVEIHERDIGAKPTYLVWMGSFKTEEDSRRFGENFKREHGKPYRIVQR